MSENAAFEREYPGARWLATQVVRQLYLTGVKADALVSAVARRSGLSHTALNALAVIEGGGGPTAVGQVTAQMHTTTATMTTVLDTLERKGFVLRAPDATDRRKVLVDITPDGQAALDEALPAVQQACAAAMGSFDDKALRNLLEALTTAADAIDAVPDALAQPARRRPPAHLRRA